jgi:hypothetical protein
VQVRVLPEIEKALHVKRPRIAGSPCATLFITVLVLPQLTENHQFQRVIKDQAVPGETEAVLMSISHNQASSRNLL